MDKDERIKRLTEKVKHQVNTIKMLSDANRRLGESLKDSIAKLATKEHG